MIKNLSQAFNNTNANITIFGSENSKSFMPVLYLDTTGSNSVTELYG